MEIAYTIFFKTQKQQANEDVARALGLGERNKCTETRGRSGIKVGKKGWFGCVRSFVKKSGSDFIFVIIIAVVGCCYTLLFFLAQCLVK